ncbi:MAG: MAC/perforin domain-containing protein, partial [Pseudomonadota bacterium]
PLGLTLIQEATQGMVFNKSAVSSGSELQTTLSLTMGANMKGNGYAMGVPVETTASYEATASAMASWESNKTVAQAIGFSRAKQYALVVDHPYATLSDDFLDAVEDARRYANYTAIIDKFGTHYPYAVTYGAAAKVTHSFTEDSWRKVAEVNAGFKVSAGAETLGSGGSSYFGANAGVRTGSSGSVGEEGATFVAVGGNGSWNENGYSAGPTPYPILMDLRPLYELLNPLNFPNEPEIYQGVREELRLHTEAYIAKFANRISDRSLLPLVEPKRDEPIETWRIYVRHIWCTDGKIGMVSDVEGTLSLDGYIGSNRDRYATTKDKKLSVVCKKKKQTKKYSYKSGAAGMLEIQGTRAQIAAYTIALELNWHYLPFGKKHPKNSKKNYKQPDALKNGLKPGTSKDYRWTVGKKANPDFTLSLRMKRIK